VRVVVAPCSFKGSLTASDAAEAIARGLRRTHPHDEVALCPVADGGEGTLALLARARDARVHNVELSDGRVAPLAWLGERHALIESATVVGLAAEPDVRAPLTRGTRAVGELIRAALDDGAEVVDVALGGTGTIDGGLGALAALGARALDGGGADVPDGGAGLLALRTLSLDGLDARLQRVQLNALCDVDSRLLGEHGARLYMAQKGATPEQQVGFEDGLATLSALDDDRHLAMRPGAGAAGGLGFGLALAGAQLVGGAERVLDVLSFDEVVAGAQLVITGEGRIDLQTARGKGPAVVARRARAAGAHVVALCGVRGETIPDVFDEVVALTDDGTPVERALRSAAALLEERAAALTPPAGSAAD
jgi:glycerate kinase